MELGELCPQDKLWRVEKVSSADNLKGGEGKFWDGNLNTVQSAQGNPEDLGNMLGEKDDEDKQQIDGLGKMKANHAKRKFVEMHAFAEVEQGLSLCSRSTTGR